jgi:hypothetical protein
LDADSGLFASVTGATLGFIATIFGRDVEIARCLPTIC